MAAITSFNLLTMKIQLVEELAVNRRTILRDVSKMKIKIKIAFDKKLQCGLLNKSI